MYIVLFKTTAGRFGALTKGRLLPRALAGTKSLNLNPNNPVAYNNRGVAYSKLENPQNAIDDFTRAIQINPDYAMAYLNRSNEYGFLGDYQKTISDLTEIIRIDPFQPWVYSQRAFAKQLSVLPYCEDYKTACELDTNYCEFYRGLMGCK